MLLISGEKNPEDSDFRAQVPVVGEGAVVAVLDGVWVVRARLHHEDGEVHIDEPAFGSADAAKPAIRQMKKL